MQVTAGGSFEVSPEDGWRCGRRPGPAGHEEFVMEANRGEFNESLIPLRPLMNNAMFQVFWFCSAKKGAEFHDAFLAFSPPLGIGQCIDLWNGGDGPATRRARRSDRRPDR